MTVRAHSLEQSELLHDVLDQMPPEQFTKALTEALEHYDKRDTYRFCWHCLDTFAFVARKYMEAR